MRHFNSYRLKRYFADRESYAPKLDSAEWDLKKKEVLTRPVRKNIKKLSYLANLNYCLIKSYNLPYFQSSMKPIDFFYLGKRNPVFVIHTSGKIRFGKRIEAFIDDNQKIIRDVVTKFNSLLPIRDIFNNVTINPVQTKSNPTPDVILQELAEFAKPYVDNSTKTVPNLKSGQYFSHGDLNFWALPKIPADARLVPTPSLSLSGSDTSEVGKRHSIRLEDLDKVTFYRLNTDSLLVGLVLVFTQAIEIEHEEHANIIVNPPESGILGITFQRKHGKEIRRIAD